MTTAATLDDTERGGGLAVLLELPRLLGAMLRWWVANVLPYLHRPWEAPDVRVGDRIPRWEEQIAAHFELTHEECDSPRGRCRVHGYRA